ncbi:MAG: Rrf2 family transcriptional regulator [Pirellulaceae bacterium]
MSLSAKTEYACIALLELAVHFGSGEPVRIRQIADPHGIPSRFLVQILLQLKGAGLVSSTRGASGGYQLIRPPEQITLGEVMAVVEGGDDEPVSNTNADTAATRVLLDTWRRVAAKQREMLAHITFADLAQLVRGETENMYYI